MKLNGNVVQYSCIPGISAAESAKSDQFTENYLKTNSGFSQSFTLHWNPAGNAEGIALSGTQHRQLAHTIFARPQFPLLGGLSMSMRLDNNGVWMRPTVMLTTTLRWQELHQMWLVPVRALYTLNNVSADCGVLQNHTYAHNTSNLSMLYI